MQAFTATAMCSPEPRELPHRHVSLAPRRDAHADRGRPLAGPPQPARRAAHGRAAGGERRGRRARAWRARSCAACCAWARRAADEPELPPGMPTLATHAARARLPRRAQGQVAPHKPVTGASWSAADTRAHRARLRLRRLGAAGRRRRRQGRALRRRQRGTTHEGWDEDYTRQVEALARPQPTFPSPSA